MKGILKAVITTVLCSAVFLGAAFTFLHFNKQESENVNEQKAETKDYSVPYSPSLPADCGVLAAFPDSSGCLIYFDFTNSSITTLFCDDIESIGKEYKGYSVNYNLEADFNLLSSIIDRSGGVEMNLAEEILRYTGMQITDILSTMGDTTAIRAIIARAVFESIAENGVASEDLVFIIENCETDLSVPICLNWHKYLKDMAANATVIN